MSLTLSDLSLAVAHLDAELAKVRAERNKLLKRKTQLEMLERALEKAVDRALQARLIAEREST